MSKGSTVSEAVFRNHFPSPPPPKKKNSEKSCLKNLRPSVILLSWLFVSLDTLKIKCKGSLIKNAKKFSCKNDKNEIDK